MSNEEIRKLVAVAMVTLYVARVTVNLCTIQSFIGSQGFHLAPQAIVEAMHEIFHPLTTRDQAEAIMASRRPGQWLISLH